MPARGNTSKIAFWSRAGASSADPALRRGRAGSLPRRLPLEPDGRFYRARLAVPAAGTLVISIACPRPLRLWLQGVLVLDENLFWRQFQREVRAAVLFPCAGGELEARVDVGPRPSHPQGVDVDCPSRNRERVAREIRRRWPDVITLTARVEQGANVPPMSLRFSPSQFYREAVAWQHVLVRPLKAGLQPPSVNLWSQVEEPPSLFTLVSPVWPHAAVEATTEAERAAGLRHFHVPVAEPQDSPPPLRTTVRDPRIEPSIEIARTLDLIVEGPAGRLSLPMPAYEGLGRLAPQREFRAINWPSPDRLRAAVPAPVLPDSLAPFLKTYYAAWDMLLGLVRHPDPCSGLPGSYVSTGAGFVHHQFVWDTSFTAMCTCYGWRAFDAVASLDVLYSRQFDGGYIHREHDVRDGLPAMYEPDFSPNPPIMSVAEWKLANLTGNVERLRKIYPCVKANHEWLRHNRRLPDGTYWTTGLANGLDNSPSLGDGYPDLTAQMAHEAEILGRMAALLGHGKDAAAFTAEHASTGRALNRRLWSKSMRIYSTSLPNGGHNPNKVATAFWPLWAGVVPADRVEALAVHLKDPSSFWRHHPIPSLAADSPFFRPEGDYWRGSTWAPTNYAAIKGFDRAGRHDLAVETALRHLQCMTEVLNETGYIWENYCSEASRRGNWSGANYCWSALGPIALLIEVIIGVETLALRNTLRWNPPAGQTIGVRNLPLGPATVSLLQRAGEKGDAVEVETDRAFTIELRRKRGVSRHRCPPGRTQFPA